MGWVMIDDAFFRHPKIIDLPPNSKLLFVGCLCHCADQLTDGYVSTAALRAVAAVCGVPEKASRALVDSGMLHKRNGGYDIHDYLDYQRSADQERRRRQSTAERVRRWREKNGNAQGNGYPDPSHPPSSDDVGNGVTSGVGDAPSNAPVTPSPNPNPITVTSHPPTHVGSDARRDDDENSKRGRRLAGEALDRITDQRMIGTTPKSPSAYRAKVRAQVAEEHHQALCELNLPGFTDADQIVAVLEPPLPPRPPDPLERTRQADETRMARALQPECPRCGTHGGNGWLETDNGVIRCPTCTPARSHT